MVQSILIKGSRYQRIKNMDKLSPQLNSVQLKQNIDALITQNAPREVIQSYINNYSKNTDGNYVLKTATANPVDKAPVPVPERKPIDLVGMGNNIKNDIKNRGAAAQEAISGESDASKGENPIVRGFQAAAEGAGAITDVGTELFKTIASHFRTPSETLAKAKAEGTVAPDYQYPTLKVPDFLKKIADGTIKGSEAVAKQINDWADKHPEAGKDLISTLKVLSASGDIAGAVAGADIGAAGANKIPVVGEDLSKVAPKVEELATKGIKKTTDVIDSTIAGRAAAKAEKTTKTALEAITPATKDLTPTEYELLLRQNKITPSSLNKPSKYILSDAEKATATKYQDLLQGNDPVKNSKNVMNEIVSKDKQVGQFLSKNNGAFNDGEFKNFIGKKLEGISDVTVPESRVAKLKKTLINNFVKELPKNDMESLWKARKAFDQKIESAFSGSPTLQNEVKREFRNAVQDFVAERTPDNTYKNFMKDMTELYNMHDTIATKAIKQKGNSWLMQWIKNNPIKAKVIGYGVGGTVLDKTLKITTGIGL